jgi:hypothetical protein
MSRACSNLHLGMTAEPATLARLSPVRASTTDVLQCWCYVMSGGSLVLSSGHWLMVVAGVGDATCGSRATPSAAEAAAARL